MVREEKGTYTEFLEIMDYKILRNIKTCYVFIDG